MRGSHKIVIERVSVPSRWESKKGKKNEGWGEGKDIMAIERFSVAMRLW
jgi:hypothetical protein